MEKKLNEILKAMIEAHRVLQVGRNYVHDNAPEEWMDTMAEADQALIEAHRDLEQLMQNSELKVLLAFLRGMDTTPKNELRFSQAAGGSRIYVKQGHTTLEMNMIEASPEDLSELFAGALMLTNLSSSRMLYLYDKLKNEKEGS